MQPGEIILPTPVIRRARGHQLSSPLQQPRWADSQPPEDGKKRFGAMRGPRGLSVVSELEMDLQLLRNRLSSTKLSLYESLLRALHSLLTATLESSLSPKGNKSLMAMCLRKLPEHIDELEYWEQLDAEEQGTKSTLQDSKVSAEIYEDVEAILPPARNGCPPLRQLVRAHGIKLITNAMAEGLLDTKFAMLLIKLCSKMKAYSEAEGLLETLLSLDVFSPGNAAPKTTTFMVYPKPKSVESTFEEGRKLAPLKALRNFAKESGRPQFMLRQLSKLISTGKLPLEWLPAQEFVSIWSGIVKTLSGHQVCDDTVSFAIDIITTLASQVRKTVYSLKPEPAGARALSQQTLLSTITTVATLPLFKHDTRSLLLHGQRQDATSVTSQRVEHIMKSCIYEMEKSRKPSWVTTVLDLGAFYAGLPRSASSGGKGVSLIFTDTGSARGVARQHREAATALICTFAQFLGRGTSEPSHNFLGSLLDRLDSVLCGDKALPRGFRADCAFFLAERTLDLRDLAFAESFNGNVDTAPGVQTTPRQPASSPSAKFRWDEGIAEWVTATPAVAEKQPLLLLPPTPPRRRSLRRRSSRPAVETCQEASPGPDDGRFANGDVPAQDAAPRQASAKHAASKQGTKQGTRRGGNADAAAAAAAAATRKRKLASITTKSSRIGQSDDDYDEEEEEGAGEYCNVTDARNRAQGDDGSSSSSSGREPKRQRRRAAVVMKPYGSMMKGFWNKTTGGAESSEDELGL